MDRFYRKPPLEEAYAALNALVAEHNRQVDAWNARQETAQADADQRRARLKAEEAAIAALDRDLAIKPDPDDAEATQAHLARLKERNARVERFNRQVEETDAVLKGYKTAAGATKPDMDARGAEIGRRSAELKARSRDLEAFQEKGQDLAFFSDLNGLLADLRQAQRAGAEVTAALTRVRALRRELAQWAIARQRADAFGLVVVEARVGDEPAWFIVDTGAMRVCLSTELVRAAGFQDRLGEEGTVSLPGGMRTRGRAVVLPSLTVAGHTGQDVAGSALPASDVGIDGLLGQSFLRRFSWTLDRDRPEPLIIR